MVTASQKKEGSSGVVQYILPYRAPVWHNMVHARPQHTTSMKALQVITAIVPIELSIEERQNIYKMDDSTQQERRRASKVEPQRNGKKCEESTQIKHNGLKSCSLI